MFGGREGDAETVVRLLAGQVRRDIFFGILPPDTRLKIEDLRQRYGGSAHSFREALTLLASEGLVEANAQRGFRVASATQTDLEDITRLRSEIEPLGLTWAIRQGDIRWEGAVLASYHTYSRMAEQAAAQPMEFALEWDEAGRAFHAALVSACGSSRLIDFQEKLYLQSRRFRFAALGEGQIDVRLNNSSCQKIVEAALAHNVEEASFFLREHVLRAITN